MIDRVAFQVALVLVFILAAAGVSAFEATIAQQDSGASKNIERIDTVRAVVYGWAESWANKDIDTYMAYYNPRFRSGKINYRQWREKKAAVFQRPGAIFVKIYDLWVFVEGNTATASFVQKYQDARYADVGEKVLKLVQVGNRWQIISEQWKPLKG